MMVVRTVTGLISVLSIGAGIIVLIFSLTLLGEQPLLFLAACWLTGLLSLTAGIRSMYLVFPEKTPAQVD